MVKGHSVIRINGIKDVGNYVVKLPKKEKDAIWNESKSFMDDMYNNIQLMAPHATGFLKSQISIKIWGPERIIIDFGDAYYAEAQDEGFPAHIIPIEYIEQHMGNPGMSPGIEVKNPFGFAKVGKNTPFITPAFEMALNQLNSRFSNALSKAL